ncbi:MAG: pitrilysin family protein [Candidatus Omnitrophota bacterium]|jgi:predicted Zn-dependent peptidase
MYKKLNLANGLRIVAFRMPERRSAALGIWIKAGGRYESGSNKGISHFLEHLLFKGSKKYSCRKIKESIEGVGGSLNGFTSEELTCYLAKIPARFLGLALDILSDMVINPSLPLPEIEKEKQVILEEIKMYKDQPQSHVHELLDELLWPRQPLGAPVIGRLDSVSRLTRDDLGLFKEKFYTSPNIVVSVAGLFDGRLMENISRIFSQAKKQEINKFIPAREEQNQPQLKIFSKKTEQTHLALGFHSFPSGHPLKHVLSLLHIILGANMSSRLFHELREKNGLAYEIGTQLKRFQDTGAFIVHAGVDNRKVAEAVSLILKELKKVKLNLVRPDEFKRAKEFYLGQLMLALEDTLDHMLWIGETTVSLNKTYALPEIIKEVAGIKREDIREAAKYIFQDRKLNLSLIGPLKDKESSIYNQLSVN